MIKKLVIDPKIQSQVNKYMKDKKDWNLLSAVAIDRETVRLLIEKDGKKEYELIPVVLS